MASILVEFLLVGNDGPGVELKCIGNMETMNRSLQDFSSPCGFAGENHEVVTLQRRGMFDRLAHSYYSLEYRVGPFQL